MTDNVTDIELGTLTASGWDTSSAPVASTANVWQSTSDPTVSSDSTIGARIGDVWINTATGIEFKAISNAAGAAIWRPKPRVWQSGTTVSITGVGSDSESIMATVAIPAGAMGLHGSLDVEPLLAMTSSANNKLFKIRLGGIAGDQFATLTFSTGIASERLSYRILNAGAANAQVGFVAANTVSWGGAAGANPTGTQDTTAAKDLVITGQLALTSETFSLKGYRVMLTRPDIGP